MYTNEAVPQSFNWTKKLGEKQILTVRQRIDLRILTTITVDSAETSKGVLTIDIHSTRSADILTARPTKSKSGINFVLDFD